MCINFVISNKSLSEWNWKIVNSEGKILAASPHSFKTRVTCIDDAETFQAALPNAKFYDFAGIPIDPMHLKNGSLNGKLKPIKVRS